MFDKLYLCSIALVVLIGDVKNCNDRKVTVTGVALNDKGGAFVLTSKGMYFLDGIDEWDDEFYNKKVSVIGKLVLKKLDQQSTDSVKVQEIVGTMAILKRPKWTLLE